MQITELENLRATPNPTYKTLSVVIPVHNEVKTIEAVIDLVIKAPVLGLHKQIIIVDDYSTDGTTEKLLKINRPGVEIIISEANTGKGGALQKGFQRAKGDLIIIQDADLEYDSNLFLLIRPILSLVPDIYNPILAKLLIIGTPCSINFFRIFPTGLLICI
jgi:glycosyltransferase involved in cell wall biosynthesis